MSHTHPVGHFVLADLSGYTPFLAGVERDHGEGVLRDLREGLVAGLSPVLHLVSFEGDAIFAFVPASQLARGETLLELLETAYAGFRAQQESIARRTTCGCRACRQIPELDLKFLVHSGEYHLSRVDGRAEPLGLAADLVRSRALKPAGAARGYALLTAESLDWLRLEPAAVGGAREEVADREAGPLTAYRLDLQARFAAERVARQAASRDELADGTAERDLAAPPAVVWEWLNDPVRRSQWTAGRHWHAGVRPAGRTGPGARNHCDHGLGSATETVLDWHPFERFTVEIRQRGSPVVHQSYVLEPGAGGQGTHLRATLRFQPPLPRWLARSMARLGGRPLLQADLGRLAKLLEAEPAE
jgi:uncharacterized protein YndB with AHSA1/START domain